MKEEELIALGYKRVEYNDGTVWAYLKAFNGLDDPQDLRACRIEVRFNEWSDCLLRAYLVLPGFMLPLPGLQSIEQVEALYEILKRGASPTERQKARDGKR